MLTAARLHNIDKDSMYHLQPKQNIEPTALHSLITSEIN
jgi:hypothetical protein